MTNPHRADIDAILAKRHDNGGDFWATPDHRIYVGSPFSTLSSLGMLHEQAGLHHVHTANQAGGVCGARVGGTPVGAGAPTGAVTGLLRQHFLDRLQHLL